MWSCLHKTAQVSLSDHKGPKRCVQERAQGQGGRTAGQERRKCARLGWSGLTREAVDNLSPFLVRLPDLSDSGRVLTSLLRGRSTLEAALSSLQAECNTSGTVKKGAAWFELGAGLIPIFSKTPPLQLTGSHDIGPWCSP